MTDALGDLRLARFFMVLVTISYFVRPQGWFPPLMGKPVYQYTVIPCIILSFGSLFSQLNWELLYRRPINACVALLLIVVMLSNFLHPNPEVPFTIEFAKTSLYFFLIVALVSTEELVERFMGWMVVILSFSSILMILVLNGHLNLAANAAMLMDEGNVRAQSLGGAMFDPNDYAAILLVAIVPTIYNFFHDRRYSRRAIWGAAGATLLYALYLTQSRGGLLGFTVSMSALAFLHWNWKRVLVFGAPAIVLAMAAEGRMTDIEAVSFGTGQSRIQLWHSLLATFKQHPLFGVGPLNFHSIAGQASHNSFLQAFAELGFAGGALFLGAFIYSLSTIYRVLRTPEHVNEITERAESLMRIMFAVTCGLMTTSLALSHTYLISTYMVLGINSSLLSQNTAHPEVASRPFSLSLLSRFFIISLICLAASYVLANLLVRW